jgi:flavin-binding protein dodecin
MNSNNTVYAGQSFLDKVVELTGSVENAFQMATVNGISISDTLDVGSTIEAAGTIKKAIVARFNDLNRPATLYTEVEDNYELPGEFPLSF